MASVKMGESADYTRFASRHPCPELETERMVRLADRLLIRKIVGKPEQPDFWLGLHCFIWWRWRWYLL